MMVSYETHSLRQGLWKCPRCVHGRRREIAHQIDQLLEGSDRSFYLLLELVQQTLALAHAAHMEVGVGSPAIRGPDQVVGNAHLWRLWSRLVDGTDLPEVVDRFSEHECCLCGCIGL